jgi:3-(3-hydroxy-phenyl)propionate hydroxylase
VHGALPAGRHRWEFLLARDETEGDLEHPDAVRRLLAERGHADAEVLRARVYPHHARVADHLVDGRVLLLGDAAHLSPPFAGQGLSAGLRDAMAAAWRAATVAHGRGEAASLARYEAERRSDVVRSTALAVVVGAAVQTRDRRLAAVRDGVLAALWRLPGVEAWSHSGGWKPSGAPPRRALGSGGGLSPARWGRRRAMGRRLPQPLVTRPDGCVLRLDDALGPAFALLGLGLDSLALLDGPTRATLRGLGIRAVEVIGGEASVAPRPAALLDPEDALARHLGRRSEGSLVLVRPDRIVAGAFGHAEASRLLVEARALVAGRR